MLWHRTHRYTVRDLEAEGWRRADVEGAELAFSRPGQGVIAVRSQCGADVRSPQSRSRSLWHRVPHETGEQRIVRVGEHTGLETTAESDGTRVRTVVVRAGGCAIDMIHVAPGGAGETAFEDFLASFRSEGEPTQPLPGVATP